MPWITPIWETIVDEIKSLFVSLRPDVDSTKYSDLWIYSRTLGHIVQGLHEHIDVVLARIFPTTTSGQWLDRWLYFIGASNGQGSYGLYQPHVSSGTDACRVTATGAGTIQYEELLDDAGRRYRLNEASPYTFPGGGGTYDADIVSIDTGLGVNLEIGESLTFVTPPVHIQDTATIVVDLDFGRSLETDESGRNRLVKKLQTPSLSGNWAQWVEWIENSSLGNFEAWVWPTRNNGPYGHGTVDYTATQVGESGVSRETTSIQQTIIETYLATEAPDAFIKQIRFLDIDVLERTISMTYQLATGTPTINQCDWDAEANKKDVKAETPGSFLIEATSAYGSGVIESGDHILIAGEEAIVDLEPGNASAPVSGNYSKFTVTTWPWSVDLVTGGPSGGAFAICASGGIIMTVYNALKDYLNSLGPARGDYAAPQTDWDDTIRVKYLQSAAVIAGDGWIRDITSTLIAGASADNGPTSYDTTANVQLMAFDEIEIYQEAL